MAERVLIVDDEQEFLDVMSERLTVRGIEAVTADSGEEALKKIETEVFDTVILDLRMPGIDGLEALRRIKEKRPELQVILLTGHATVESGIDAMKSGAMDFIEKPADLEALHEKIKAAKQKKILIMEKTEKDKVVEMLRRYGV